MSEIQPRIVIVEDDLPLAEWMRDYLVAKGYQIILCHRGDEAVDLIRDTQPDVVILDGMLPGLDGFDICKALRPGYANAIIMVTARDEEIDEVLGLEMGADDYLTKPVRARALLTRIRKYLDKQAASIPAAAPQDNQKSITRLEFNNLRIDAQSRIVSLDGQELNISSNEFDVLWLLASRAGEVVTREQLVNDIRGFEYDGFDRSIDLRVSRLRRKLNDDTSQPYRIKTIWGKGYLFAPESW